MYIIQAQYSYLASPRLHTSRALPSLSSPLPSLQGP